MQPLEFTSRISNGVITIPSRYRASVPSNVRVILIPNEKKTGIPQEITELRGILAGKGFDNISKKKMRKIFNEDNIS